MNPHVGERLKACLKQLRAAREGSATLSSASKGTEREQFVDVFLRNVLPPGNRFGTGDITDVHGHRSGQIDVVIENAMVPSFPLVGGGARLYLAEGVAAAIEVKSDLAAQWPEVVATARAVAQLQTSGGYPVPFFVVGYRGWAKFETLEKHACEASDSGARLSGVVCLEPALFIGGRLFPEQQPALPHPSFPNVMVPQPAKWVNKHLVGEEEHALFCLLALLHDCTSHLIFGKNTLLDYMTITDVPTSEPQGSEPSPT
jgi:hypothetical protein